MGQTSSLNQSSPKKQLYFIEGNISSGKSTVIEGLKNEGFVVFDEPLDDWTEKYVDEDGENILAKFYNDMTRYSFQFEVLVMTTRWKKIRAALDHESNIIFIERSIKTDRNTFAPNLKEEKHITGLDWKIYEDWYDTFVTETKHHLKDVEVNYIYLRTEPEECHERRQERGREEEDKIPIEYLQQLHNKLETWLNANSVIIDGHKSKEEVLEDIIKLSCVNNVEELEWKTEQIKELEQQKTSTRKECQEWLRNDPKIPEEVLQYLIYLETHGIASDNWNTFIDTVTLHKNNFDHDI